MKKMTEVHKGYAEMVADEAREAEALAWIEAGAEDIDEFGSN